MTSTVVREEPQSIHAIADPVLIRCTGCTEEAGERSCAASCEPGAVVVILGDLLVEQRKCGPCERNAGNKGPLPACIAACENAADKRVLAGESAEQKRVQAASVMPWLL
jgi:hypothetical protein